MSTLGSYIQSMAPTNWFKLDELSGDVLNSGSYPTPGTLLGSVTRGVPALHYDPGPSDKAISFGGLGSFMVAHNVGMITGSPWSVFFRAKLVSLAGYFFQKGNNTVGGGQGVSLACYSGSLVMNWFNGSWYNNVVVGALPSVGTDATIIVVYDGGTAFRSYVNGVKVSTTLAAAFPNTTQGLNIGALNPNLDPINGTLDDFAWFNFALTDAQCGLLRASAMGAPYAVGGYILDANSQPVSRVVRAYRRDTGVLLAQSASSAGTGAYSMDTWYNGEVQVVMLDDALGTLENDQILRTTPV